jgi:hypothetical protein
MELPPVVSFMSSDINLRVNLNKDEEMAYVFSSNAVFVTIEGALRTVTGRRRVLNVPRDLPESKF